MIHKKKSKFKRRVVKFLILFLTLIMGVFFLFEHKARDLIYNSVGNELEIIAQSAMDDAVLEVLSEYSPQFDDLVTSKINENGDVISLQTESRKLNLLKSKLSKAITENISSGKTVKVSVPVGAFTGIVLFSSLGPDLPVTLSMDGSCTATIESEFSSAGINQTLHHIYLYVEADVSLGCPIIDYEDTIASSYELSQTVIVGGTPDMYANVNN